MKTISKVIDEVIEHDGVVYTRYEKHEDGGISIQWRVGGELIGRVGIYGGHISFYRFGSNVVRNVDSTFGEDGLFMEWFKITYLDKIYNVNVVAPPFDELIYLLIKIYI